MRMKCVSPVKSPFALLASGWRSSDLGLMMINGLRNDRSIWRRNTWK